MPNLKDLKLRISSVKSTQKITKAMKMVAASKLRKAVERANDAEPYAKKIDGIIASILEGKNLEDASPLLFGNKLCNKLGGSAGGVAHGGASGEEQPQPELIILVSSDRGLCGAVNSHSFRRLKKLITENKIIGKETKLIAIGKKGGEFLRANYGSLLLDVKLKQNKDGYGFAEARQVADFAIEMFEKGEIGNCKIVYNNFVSVISQVTSEFMLFPLCERGKQEIDIKIGGGVANDNTDNTDNTGNGGRDGSASGIGKAKDADSGKNSIIYEYEPGRKEVLDNIIRKDIATQIYNIFLQNQASEHASRMTAMDNATRNAGEMINKLTLQYNRTRQAAITTELIEIISGAEAI